MTSKTVVYCKQDGEAPIPITVRIKWLADGTITPLKYWSPDGSCFDVVHIYDRVLLAHLKDHDKGIRFKVIAELVDMPDSNDELLHAQYETYLYFADS